MKLRLPVNSTSLRTFLGGRATRTGAQEFITEIDKVVVIGHERMRVKSNGRSCETDRVHVFTLRNGKVVKIHEYYDTAVIVAAFRGE